MCVLKRMQVIKCSRLRRILSFANIEGKCNLQVFFFFRQEVATMSNDNKPFSTNCNFPPKNRMGELRVTFTVEKQENKFEFISYIIMYQVSSVKYETYSSLPDS